MVSLLNCRLCLEVVFLNFTLFWSDSWKTVLHQIKDDFENFSLSLFVYKFSFIGKKGQMYSLDCLMLNTVTLNCLFLCKSITLNMPFILK